MSYGRRTDDSEHILELSVKAADAASSLNYPPEVSLLLTKSDEVSQN